MGIREQVYFEGGPHRGDLILNLVLGLTLVWLPLTIASVIRALWVHYRITDRRVTVVGGWLGRNRSDVIYSEIARAAIVPRGIGFWGDMVLTLRDGSRLELRALPRFREIYAHVQSKLGPAGRPEDALGASTRPA